MRFLPPRPTRRIPLIALLAALFTAMAGALVPGAEIAPLEPPVRSADQVYQDAPFLQEMTTIFEPEMPLDGYELRGVRVDRDGKILIATHRGLLKGYQGRLVPYNEYAGLLDLTHHDLELLEGKFVFLTDKMLLPLHGAGRDYLDNVQSGFTRVAPLAAGHYLLISPLQVAEIRDGQILSRVDNPGYVEVACLADNAGVVLYAQDKLALYRDGHIQPLPPPQGKIKGLIADDKADSSPALLAATDNGLFRVTASATTRHPRKLPVPELTCIARDPRGRLWLGSSRGAFSIDRDDHLNYYAGRRWLAQDRVLDIAIDREGSVYLLNSGGLTKLTFKWMTLADKAAIYQKHLRLNHIRYGLVSDVHLPEADYARLRLHDSDNDGLWSGMYLASEGFRYAVTAASDALENALDGLDALERLVTISTVPGFQARTFELKGHAVSDKQNWRNRPERDFQWKGHTSSDEIVGTFFGHAVLWETIGPARPDARQRIANVVGQIMHHILDHDLYLVDIDGKPTLWGRWNPEYVNTEQVGGDRRLNSVEILAFLQLAYHMTGQERFRQQFRELVEKHGYAQNTINYLPNPRGRWNHSDDELYWLSYYNLLQRHFDPSLRETFLASAREHAAATRRKRNPVWNFIFGATSGDPIDVAGSAMILREFPLDLRRWRMTNSHRRDIAFELSPRGVESLEVLPPDERAIHKWNGNEMAVDGGDGGESAESGAEFLLPYWMGRYYGFISPPTDAGHDDRVAEDRGEQEN